MNDGTQRGAGDETTPRGQATDQESPPGKAPVDLLALDLASAAKWRGSSRTGCGPWVWAIIAVVALALLGIGYVTLKQSVWQSVEKRSARLMERVATEVPATERDRLAELLGEFSAELATREDPYPLMGEFSARASAALADGLVSRRELRSLVDYLEAVLAGRDAPSE